MSTRDESDLERRALAAAAASGPPAPRLAWRPQESRQDAERRRVLGNSAIRQLEQILGYRTSPDDWNVFKQTVALGSTDGVMRAHITLLGVDIWAEERGGMSVVVYGHRSVGLILASFGQALEANRHLPSDFEGWD